MAIDNKTKRAVAKEWVAFFPDLHLVTPQKLYKILGNSILGIDIYPNGESYSPYFVIYPFYGNSFGINLKSVLSFPMTMVRTGSTSEDYMEREEKYRIKPKQELKDAFGVCLIGNITLSDLLSHVDEKLMLLNSHAAGGLAKLYMFKIFSALYVGNKNIAQQICDQLTPENTAFSSFVGLLDYVKDKVKNTFYQFYTFEEFRNNIQSVIDNPIPILATIEANKNDPAFKKLKRSEILPG